MKKPILVQLILFSLFLKQKFLLPLTQPDLYLALVVNALIFSLFTNSRNSYKAQL